MKCEYCAKPAQLIDMDVPYCVPHFYKLSLFGRSLVRARPFTP